MSIKSEEIANVNSCLNKADDDEMIFVLRAKDEASPKVVRKWIAERIELGLNNPGDPKLLEAEICAQAMEQQRKLMEMLERQRRVACQ